MDNLPKRKPNRLRGYDYSQSGAYFVTICVKDRAELLWNVGATFGRPYGTSHLSEDGVGATFGRPYGTDHLSEDGVGATFGRPYGAPTICRKTV